MTSACCYSLEVALCYSFKIVAPIVGLQRTAMHKSIALDKVDVKGNILIANSTQASDWLVSIDHPGVVVPGCVLSSFNMNQVLITIRAN